MLRGQRLIADAEALHHAGSKSLDQHVGRAHEPAQHGLTVWLLQVEDQAAFAAVRRAKERALSVDQRRQPAGIIAAVRIFDLDHGRAEVGQHQRGDRTRQQARQIQHAQAI
jgi:hypothetical protein